MKGKILGVATTEKSGVITGEDGKRYAYTLADWRGATSPAVGQEVDFDTGAAGGAADIYPSLTHRAIPGLSLDQANLSPAAANALTIARANPVVWAAAVALLGSAALTFVSITLPGMANMSGADAALMGSLTGNATILGLADKVGSAQDLFGLIEAQAGALGSNMGTEELGFLKTIKGLSGFLNVLYLAYLTPLLAAAVLWFELTGKSDRRITLAFAASCLVSFGLIVLFQMQIDDAIKDAMAFLPGGEDAAQVVSGSDLLEFGLGAWVILLAGLGTLGLAFNLIRVKSA